MRFLEKINNYLKGSLKPVIPEFKLDVLSNEKEIEKFGFSLVDFFQSLETDDKNLIISLNKNLKRTDMWDIFQFFYFLSHNFEATLMLKIDLNSIMNFGVMPFGWESHKVGIENVLIDEDEIELKDLELIFNEFGLSGVSLSLRKEYKNFVSGFVFGEEDLSDVEEFLYFKEVKFDNFNGGNGIILKTEFINPAYENLLKLKGYLT